MKVRLQREKDDLQRRMEAPDTVEWCLARYHRLKAYFDALCIVEVDLFAPLAGIHARPVVNRSTVFHGHRNIHIGQTRTCRPTLLDICTAGLKDVERFDNGNGQSCSIQHT